ncbi:sigma-54 dependent transcriptional regulator [Puia sp.]|uniref:sigma-54-dependent transcriptional regulator n=1 Tax=Puia sp. TaxID=2045100 RepID=UPI002F40E035
MRQKILIVEDEFVEANHIQTILEQAGYQVAGIARSVNIALEMIEAEKPSLILLDIFLKGSLTGIHLGNILKERGIAFVYLSANSTRDTLEMAKSTEPYGFLVKPFREKDVLVTLEIALYQHEHRSKLKVSKAKAQTKTGAPAAENDSLDVDVIGESRPLKALVQDVRVVAPTDTSVLILGETGTGKEMIAKMIHRHSQRSDGPLVKVNCAAMPATLIESILFGHEQGAFTGAVQRKRGKFEQADQGTIFLDEIGEIGLDMQVKLLRVLQEKEIEPLGGEEVIKVNCRVIAATNRDLEADVAAGRFRMDLYYRLNVFPLTLPPLRDRPEDIPALARHFTEQYSQKLGKPVPALAPAVLAELQRSSWPGNIRQLEHTIERAVLLAQGDTIREIAFSPSPARTEQPAATLSSMEDLEKNHIIEVLRQCDGKIAGKGGAAELLKMPASTLNSRIKKLGIRKFRNIY